MSKPREFWIDESDASDDDLPLAFREHPRQGPLQWQYDLVHVIEKSHADKLEAALKEAVEALKFYEKYQPPSDQVCCNLVVQVSEFETVCCGYPITMATQALARIEEVLK